jgi:hypothetical protein
VQKKYLTLVVRRRTNFRRDAGLNASGNGHVAKVMGTSDFELHEGVAERPALGTDIVFLSDKRQRSDKDRVRIAI